MNQKDIDGYYLEIARAVAVRSTCLFCNVGCVIVDKDDNVISTAYLVDKIGILNCRKNGICSYEEHSGVKGGSGKPDTCDYMFPEVNAILTADRERLKDATMYIHVFDTVNKKITGTQLEKTLSKIILSSGIKRIVMPQS